VVKGEGLWFRNDSFVATHCGSCSSPEGIRREGVLGKVIETPQFHFNGGENRYKAWKRSKDMALNLSLTYTETLKWMGILNLFFEKLQSL
jgi:hypothetical protein